MKKSYLDALYEKREGIKSKIEQEKKDRNNPTVQCCENMVHNNIHDANLILLRLWLTDIDELISIYLSVHQKKD